MKTFVVLIAVIFLFAAYILQITYARPEPQEKPVTADEDKFAKQAAEALDNTILMFKNGINNLFEDGSKLSNLFNNVTESIKKLTHVEGSAGDSRK